MKDFDLDKVDNLLKLKESLNNVIDGRINGVRLNESVKSIDEMPFLAVNGIFEGITDKLYESKNGKSLIRKYVKTLKESKDLKNVYRFYNTLKNANGVSNPSLFLQESISLSKPKDSEKCLDELNKVREIVKECVKEVSLTSDEIDGFLNEYKGSVNESIEYIVNNKKTVKNLDEYVQSMSNVVSYITENKTNKNKSVNESKKVSELVGELDRILGEGMEAWESRVVKDIAMSEINGKSKETLFEEYKGKCISSIEDGINGTDTEKASRLTEMKARLSAKKFNEETVNEDLLKLSELMDTLS